MRVADFRHRHVLLLALLVLAGCGSSSTPNGALGAVAVFRSTIQAFDRAPQGSVSDSIAACRQARHQLGANAGVLQTSSGGAPSLRHALAKAYSLAIAGFELCATASPLDYGRMQAADATLAEANVWLQQARNLATHSR